MGLSRKLILCLLMQRRELRQQETTQLQKSYKKKRKYWIHDLYLRRYVEGEFHTIRKELLCDELKFQRYYRMTPKSYAALLEVINNKYKVLNFNSRDSISIDEKLTVALRFLATSDSFVSLAYRFRIAAQTIGRIVGDMCEIIWDVLSDSFMPLPNTATWKKNADDMWNYRQFPNCLGCVDGKHIRIQKPNNGGSLYFNYKSFNSVILLAVVNANYEFVTIDVGSFGHNCDSSIFKASNFGRKLLEGSLKIPSPEVYPGSDSVGPYTLISDKGFPLHLNITTISNVQNPFEETKNI